MASGGSDYRSRYRQRAHEQAHAEPEPVLPNIPQSLSLPRGEPEIVTTDAGLVALVDVLRSAGSFAYDSEFIGESSYDPKLCLYQVATDDSIALIDPLCDVDLRPFWELLCDPAVEKVVHAGAQDIEPVARYTGRPACNVFDTQIAAGFASMAYPTSLLKLVGELTGVVLKKGLTFTDWSQRPLSGKQIRYAADDVRFLPTVARELKRLLATKGHPEWVRAECDLLCEPGQYAFDPSAGIEKVRGAGSLEPREQNILRALYEWRDAAARRADLPARAFLKDDLLIDIVRARPSRADGLSRLRGLPRPVIEREGDAIIACVTAGLAVSTAGMDATRPPEPTPRQKFSADAFWAATQTVCLNRSIDPAVVTSRAEIVELYRRLVGGRETDDLRIMQNWRREAVGEQLVSVFHGREQVRLETTFR